MRMCILVEGLFFVLFCCDSLKFFFSGKICSLYCSFIDFLFFCVQHLSTDVHMTTLNNHLNLQLTKHKLPCTLSHIVVIIIIIVSPASAKLFYPAVVPMR